MQAKHHLPQQEWFKTATSQEKANKNLQCRIGILKKKLLEPSGHFHSCIKVFSLRDWLNPYQGLLEIQWIKLIYLHRGCKIVFFCSLHNDNSTYFLFQYDGFTILLAVIVNEKYYN